MQLCGHSGALHLSFLSANGDGSDSVHCCHFQMPGGVRVMAKSLL